MVGAQTTPGTYRELNTDSGNITKIEFTSSPFPDPVRRSSFLLRYNGGLETCDRLILCFFVN